MGDITFALRGGEAWRSPWADYRRLRNESPVHFVPAAGDNTDFHVLSRFADVFRAVRDTETFSSAQGLTPNADAMTMFDAGQEPIVMMDPPNHTAMRRLVGKQMTPRRVSQIEGAVGVFVDACLDRVADAGGSPVDIVEVLFKPLPSFVVAHYLGVPAETRANFDEWTNAIVAANAEGSFESAMDATTALLGFAGELIVWLVAHLHRSEAAFWMWHHDGCAAVACGKASSTCGGAVRIGWIGFRWLASEVNVAGCDLIAANALLEVTFNTIVGAAFTVGNRNG